MQWHGKKGQQEKYLKILPICKTKNWFSYQNLNFSSNRTFVETSCICSLIQKSQARQTLKVGLKDSMALFCFSALPRRKWCDSMWFYDQSWHSVRRKLSCKIYYNSEFKFLVLSFFKKISAFHNQRTIFKCKKVLFSKPSIINIQKPQLEHYT